MRILIVRLSAIGDIVMASGLIPALRRRWPEAHIAWLAEPAGATLLAANPRLNEVIIWPRAEWRRLRSERRYVALARSVRRFASELRRRDFDLVLDTQGLLKSGIWAWLSRAPRRVGIGSREGSERLMTEVIPAGRGDPRIGSEYRALAEHLGIKAERFPMDVALDDADHAKAGAALADAGIQGRYAVLCPFTTRAQKHWFDESWRELIALLGDRLGLSAAVLGGPDDRDHGTELIDAGGANLAGRLSLRESAAAVAGASVLIGVDTGLTHMGTAYGIPTVALFGSTRPYLRTDSPLTRVMYEPLWCSPCRRRPICGGVFSCMRLHRPEDVLAVASRLLDGPAA